MDLEELELTGERSSCKKNCQLPAWATINFPASMIRQQVKQPPLWQSTDHWVT